MNIVNLIFAFAIGLVVGTAVHLSDPDKVKLGISGSIISGITGAVAGGYLAFFLLGQRLTGINLVLQIIIITGSLLFTVIYRLVFRTKSYIKMEGSSAGKPDEDMTYTPEKGQNPEEYILPKGTKIIYKNKEGIKQELITGKKSKITKAES